MTEKKEGKKLGPLGQRKNPPTSYIAFQGHSRSNLLVPLDSPYMVSY